MILTTIRIEIAEALILDALKMSGNDHIEASSIKRYLNDEPFDDENHFFFSFAADIIDDALTWADCDEGMDFWSTINDFVGYDDNFINRREFYQINIDLLTGIKNEE